MDKMASTSMYMFLCIVGKCLKTTIRAVEQYTSLKLVQLQFFGYVLGAHHLDLRAATAEDPDWLLDQRSSEIKLIRGWLDEYYDVKKAISASR